MTDWQPHAEDLLHEAAAGCLAGVAIGDSLGGIKENSGSLPGKKDRLSSLRWSATRACTAQTLLLAESITDRSGFVAEDFAARLSDWYLRDPEAADDHTSKVLRLNLGGEDWEKAALETQIEDPASAGNGSLIRCSPVALLRHASPTILIEDSRLSSRVTHAHSLCQWSCAFMNLVIAELLGGTTPVKAVDNALAVCAHRGDVNHEVLARAKNASVFGRLENLRPTNLVLDTFECSLWNLLHTDDFESAMLRAIQLDGDGRSICSVTGALAGAAYGIDSIPETWFEAVAEAGLMKEIAVALVEIA